MNRTKRFVIWLHLFLIGIFLFLASARAQDVTPITPPSILDNTNATELLGEPASRLLAFLSEGSNWIVAPYGIYSPTSKRVGGGIGIGYKLSDFVVPTLRLDYMDGQLFMPSGTLQLQAPLTLGKVTVIPLVFTGVATPLTGKGNDNLTPVGMFGIGAAVRLGTHWDLLADYERWTGFSGNQIRAGFAYKF